MQRVLVVERGKHIYDRHRDNPFDVANGERVGLFLTDGVLSWREKWREKTSARFTAD